MIDKFIYYDNTPYGASNEFNCVCRAISLATNIPYKTIEKLLELVSSYFGCDMLNCECYSLLLEIIFGFDRKLVSHEISVLDICIDLDDKIVLVRCNGHLTICIYGVCYDVFNCLDEKVTCYWIIE